MRYNPSNDEDEANEAAKTPVPPPTPEAIQLGVQILDLAMTPAFLGDLIRNGVGVDVPDRSFYDYSIAFRASLQPQDQLEKLLIDSALLAHVKAAQLMTKASQAGVELADVYLKAAPKFMAESRKCILALREYRSPTTTEQVTVLQQNVAQGDQQVACVVAGAATTKAVAAAMPEDSARIAAEVSVPVAAITDATPKSFDERMVESFMATPEVQKHLAAMDAASGCTTPTKPQVSTQSRHNGQAAPKARRQRRSPKVCLEASDAV